jgi:hypothetical protein
MVIRRSHRISRARRDCPLRSASIFQAPRHFLILFAKDRISHSGMKLDVNQTVDTISLGEAVDDVGPMFRGATAQVTGYADVERTGSSTLPECKRRAAQGNNGTFTGSLDPALSRRSVQGKEMRSQFWMEDPLFSAMAGLGPAIHVFIADRVAASRRGCPAQGRARGFWRQIRRQAPKTPSLQLSPNSSARSRVTMLLPLSQPVRRALG